MLATRIKPLSYLKANAPAVIEDLEQTREPLIITQNGEAKMVVQDVASYEQARQTEALLKILALGQQQIASGEVVDARQAIAEIRALKLD